jgi:two-component system response regulator FlrC
LLSKTTPICVKRLSIPFSLAGYPTLEAGDGSAALQQLKKAPVGLIISDAQMAPMDGYTLFEEVKIRYPGVPFILMTAYGIIERAIALLRAGATHYLLKPFEPASLIAEVEKHILKLPEGERDEAVAESPQMRQLLALASRVAGSDASVMITGPSGAGKEVLARYIHRHSKRHDGPFVAVNCAAIPDNCWNPRCSAMKKAHLPVRRKPCRASLNKRRAVPSCWMKSPKCRCRCKPNCCGYCRSAKWSGWAAPAPSSWISACWPPPTVMLPARWMPAFREDLYFRLNVFPLRIPALAERREDILPLARLVLNKYAEAAGRSGLSLSEEAERQLTAYSWEGNIRELENVMQRAVILAAGPAIIAADLLLDDVSGSTPLTRTETTVQPIVTAESDMKTLEKRHILDTLAAVGASRSSLKNWASVNAPCATNCSATAKKMARMRSDDLDVRSTE